MLPYGTISPLYTYHNANMYQTAILVLYFHLSRECFIHFIDNKHILNQLYDWEKI